MIIASFGCSYSSRVKWYFCIFKGILLCTLGSKNLDRWRPSSQSHTILFFADEKRLISRMRELQNPKMVNEISLVSLQGPITPRRANGRVIFLVSPRKKPGKSLCVCTLQAHAIKTDLNKFGSGWCGSILWGHPATLWPYALTSGHWPEACAGFD